MTRKQPAEPDQRQAKIEAILEAAGQVFLEQGFAGARVDEIARRAGVNKAMLYYHVGDKQALFTAVLTRNLDSALARVRAAVAIEAPPAQRFTALVTALAEAAAEADHLSLVLREATAGGGNLSDEVLSLMQALALETVQVISQGQAEEGKAGEGCLRRVEPVLVHMMMVASIMLLTVGRPIRERIAANGLIQPNIPDQPGPLAAAVADIFLHGVLSKEQ